MLSFYSSISYLFFSQFSYVFPLLFSCLPYLSFRSLFIFVFPLPPTSDFRVGEGEKRDGVGDNCLALTDWLCNWLCEGVAVLVYGWITVWLDDCEDNWGTHWPSDWHSLYMVRLSDYMIRLYGRLGTKVRGCILAWLSGWLFPCLLVCLCMGDLLGSCPSHWLSGWPGDLWNVCVWLLGLFPCPSH